MDKSHEQANETRRRNREAREAQRAAQAAERDQDAGLVLAALRAVLRDPEATSAQRLYAVAVLDNMTRSGFAPYDLKYHGSAEVAAAFAKELEAFHGE